MNKLDELEVLRKELKQKEIELMKIRTKIDELEGKVPVENQMCRFFEDREGELFLLQDVAGYKEFGWSTQKTLSVIKKAMVINPKIKRVRPDTGRVVYGILKD